MADLQLPKQDSATGRGLKTAAQAMIGFTVGLVLVVWKVPGVPMAVTDYIQHNAVQVLLLVGVPSGITSFIWNLFRKNVKTY